MSPHAPTQPVAPLAYATPGPDAARTLTRKLRASRALTAAARLLLILFVGVTVVAVALSVVGVRWQSGHGLQLVDPFHAGLVILAFVALLIAGIARWLADRAEGSPEHRAAGRATRWAGVAVASLIAVIPITAKPIRADAYARTRCHSNLRQIGTSIQMYAAENRGAFPPSFEVLMVEHELRADVFVCLASHDVPATGPTTPVTARRMHARHGHCSYVYLGAGRTAATALATEIIAYEPPGRHDASGMTVLFADATVLRLNPQATAAVLAQINAGTRPVRFPPGPPVPPVLPGAAPSQGPVQ